MVNQGDCSMSVDKEKTGKVKKVNWSRIKVFILIAVLVYAGITFINQISILREQQAKGTKLNQTEDSLEKELDFQKNKLDYIGTDKYIVKEAKERLGWLFDNETKYVEVPEEDIPEATPETPAADATPEQTTDDDSNQTPEE